MIKYESNWLYENDFLIYALVGNIATHKFNIFIIIIFEIDKFIQ